MYKNKPILPDYALVEVAWTHNDFEDEEIDIPREARERYIRSILGSKILWNKEDIILELHRLAESVGTRSTTSLLQQHALS